MVPRKKNYDTTARTIELFTKEKKLCTLPKTKKLLFSMESI